MKKIIIAFLMVGLIGCGKSTEEISGTFDMPEELKDCKMYELCGNGRCIKVIRCPQSLTSTNYNCGKTTCSTMSVEVDTVGFGEYERLKKKFNK